MPSSLAPRSLRPGDHACAWYESAADHEAVVAPYCVDGLQGHDRVLYLHDESSRNDVLALLERNGGRTDAALRTGRLHVWPTSRIYDGHGRFEPDAMLEQIEEEAADARDAGLDSLRVVAEMSWARGLAVNDDLADYESGLNDLFDRQGSSGICLYDRRRVLGGSQSERAHGLRVSPESQSVLYELSVAITETTNPYGIRLEGEVDFATSVALADALTKAVDAAEGNVHVDMSGLRFLDVGAARLLARAARQLGPTKSLVFERATRPMTRMLRMLGRDSLQRVDEAEAGE